MDAATSLIPLSFNKIMQSGAYTAFILDSGDKQFAIYTESKVGLAIQGDITGAQKIRPLTSDLLKQVLSGLGAEIMQIVIYDVQDSIFYAKLFVKHKIEGKEQILELDARPSDCLPFALIDQVPLLCQKSILDKLTPFKNGCN